MNETLKQMASHSSVRKFKTDDISKELLDQIILAARQAPTSSNLQAYSIIIVRDQEKKTKLAEYCGNQPWVKKCPVFLVICPDLKRLEQVCRKQNHEFIDDYIEMFIVATVDAALVAQNILLGAESVGLSGVMIGGIRNNPDKVSELLKLPDKVYPLMGMCLGYPDTKPMIKPRLTQAMAVFEERYDKNAFENLIGEYENVIKATGLYDGPRRKVPALDGREIPDNEYSWCEHTARRLATKADIVLRPHLKDFLLKKGFKLG